MRLFLAMLILASLPHLPDTPRNSQDFRGASSDLVVLPVIVTDKHGGFASGLAREAFAVFDNGRRVDIDLFSNEDTPVSVGLIVDASSSMRPKIGEVVAAALAFARLSNPNDELFAIRFNDDVRDVTGDAEGIRADDPAGLRQILESIRPDGRTALYDALVAGLDRLDRAIRPRKVLILISDGGDNASRTAQDAVLHRARSSNASIYTIGLFDDSDPDRNPRLLKSLARESGGERYLPKSAGPMLAACERIARGIRSGYTIGYAPPDRDGFFHHVRVEVRSPEGRRLEARTRPGYFAAAHPSEH